MIQRRLHTFETNSSSCHSITFSKDGVINITHSKLFASSVQEYCGSNNWVYDHEEGYEYDGGEDHNDAQFKMDYATVCLAEYFNRRAYEETQDYLKAHGARLEQIDHAYKEPVPQEVYDRLAEDFKKAKENITEAFSKQGVELVWEIPEPNSLEKINSSAGTYTGSFLGIEGYIDHDSSCSQHEEAPWKLAEMWMSPDDLVNFVFNENCSIHIRYCG